MKIYVWLYLFAVGIAPCRSEFEFGRVAFEEDANDMEDALRELMVSYYDVSSMSYDMSMPYYDMSMSFSYGDDSGDEGGDSADGGSGSTPHSSPTPSDASPSASPVSTTTMPTLSMPTLSTATTAPTASQTTAPTPASSSATSAPTDVPSAPTTSVDDDLVSPVLPSCFDFEDTTFDAPLFLETERDSVSFALLENMLENEMREQLPFCEDLRRGRGRGLESLYNSTYYVGNVDVAATDASCTPQFEQNNCFVAALSLKIFGKYSDQDLEKILAVVRDIIATSPSMGEALGIENGLIGPPTNSTATDGDKGGGEPHVATSSRKMSAGRIALITVLVILGVVCGAIFAYKCHQRGVNDRDGHIAETNGSDEGSGQGTMAVTTAERGEFHSA